jgi:hypothetical protein
MGLGPRSVAVSAAATETGRKSGLSNLGDTAAARPIPLPGGQRLAELSFTGLSSRSFRGKSVESRSAGQRIVARGRLEAACL